MLSCQMQSEPHVAQCANINDTHQRYRYIYVYVHIHRHVYLMKNVLQMENLRLQHKPPLAGRF